MPQGLGVAGRIQHDEVGGRMEAKWVRRRAAQARGLQHLRVVVNQAAQLVFDAKQKMASLRGRRCARERFGRFANVRPKRGTKPGVIRIEPTASEWHFDRERVGRRERSIAPRHAAVTRTECGPSTTRQRQRQPN